ncbi:hypothetical protein CC2G_009192 [Coprinopsis cinerea AmutBmut pab1-1]|nr:hypothetical protein CC2G_009192 [Coprinopsis cinerea AmutBmut pab1-1]
MFLALKVFMEFCGDKDVDLAVPAEVSCHLAWSGAAVNTPVVPLPAGADPFDISSAYRATKKVAPQSLRLTSLLDGCPCHFQRPLR